MTKVNEDAFINKVQLRFLEGPGDPYATNKLEELWNVKIKLIENSRDGK